MDVDDATNAANLASAENLVQINLGLDGTPQSSWTQDQMISYLQGLSSTINANPTEFNSGTVASAAAVGSTNLNNLALQDPSFDWSQFGSDLEDNITSAGSSLAAVGTGVQNALSSLGQTISNIGSAAQNTSAVAQWALPAILIIGVVLLTQTRSASVNKSGAAWAK